MAVERQSRAQLELNQPEFACGRKKVRKDESLNFEGEAGRDCAVVIFATMLGVSAASGSAEESAKHHSCDAPEYRQFDFWIGDWDGFEGGDAPSARLHVEKLLEGCVVHERYEGADGHKGESFSVYDASRKLWHQSWVTNRGELLVIEGTFHDGKMVLAGADRTADGRERRVRGTWKAEGATVRETAVTSVDGGKTWQPWFDLVFRPHKWGLGMSK